MTVGNVSFNAGETARVYFSADWYGNDEAMTVGDMTIGNIDVMSRRIRTSKSTHFIILKRLRRTMFSEA